MKRPFLSIIIPAYNCSRTIEKLLDSIIQGGLPLYEIQVIIVDDNSTDNFMELVEPYKNRLRIDYTTTTNPVHCPGNTREAGLPLVEGEWLCFCDNDDFFIPDAFVKVRQSIIDTQCKTVLVTGLRDWNCKTGEYGEIHLGDSADTWLHGKFYNVDLMRKYDIHFKKDLFSHEDTYFNSCWIGHLIADDTDFVFMNYYTYVWVNDPDHPSLSRRYQDDEGHLYIETYLGDYINGSIANYFDLYPNRPDKRDFLFNQVCMTLLHAYFYFQASLYRMGTDNVITNNIISISNLINQITNTFDCTRVDVVNYVYSMPDRYNNIKQSTFYSCNMFVELTSFKDFVLTEI